MSLVAGRFARVEPRRTARQFVLGLLSAAERKNCWSLAEQAGHRDPQAMQRLLRTAAWDAEAVRDDLRGFAADRLGDPAGVLINGLVITPLRAGLPAINDIQHWSTWRRQHQGQARRSHYQRRLAAEPDP